MENFFRQSYSNHSQYENNIPNQEDEIHIQYEEYNNTPTNPFYKHMFSPILDEIKPFDRIEYPYSKMLGLKISILYLFFLQIHLNPIGTRSIGGSIKDQIWLECIESIFDFISFNHLLELMFNIDLQQFWDHLYVLCLS